MVAAAQLAGAQAAGIRHPMIHSLRAPLRP